MNGETMTVYASERTSNRRPAVRLMCTCGWGTVAAHNNEVVAVRDLVNLAMGHMGDAHGVDEIRGPQ